MIYSSSVAQELAVEIEVVMPGLRGTKAEIKLGNLILTDFCEISRKDFHPERWCLLGILRTSYPEQLEGLFVFLHKSKAYF